MCVCLSAHAILAVRAIKSVTKDTVVLNVRFAAIYVGMTLLFVVLTKNDSFRSYSTFVFLLRAHILNINTCAYIIQRIHAHGHELIISGCVLADAYNIILLCSLVLVLYILRMIRRILKAALHFKLYSCLVAASYIIIVLPI